MVLGLLEFLGVLVCLSILLARSPPVSQRVRPVLGVQRVQQLLMLQLAQVALGLQRPQGVPVILLLLRILCHQGLHLPPAPQGHLVVRLVLARLEVLRVPEVHLVLGDQEVQQNPVPLVHR